MNNIALRIYLEDHLAASVAGIRLAKDCRSHSSSDAAAEFLTELIPQIEDDQGVLHDLIARIGGRRSLFRSAAAWSVTKMSSWRINLGMRSHPDLKRLEQLEGLLIGVRGKMAMWQTLAAIQDERLRDIDFESLVQKANSQLERIDSHRREAGRRAFDARAHEASP